MILGVAITALGVIGLLYAEHSGRAIWRRIAKPLASAGFLLAAVRAPAFVLPAGVSWLLMAALALSATGDMLLISGDRRSFFAGMAAFGLAHLAFGAWFLAHGFTWWVLATAAIAFMGVGHGAWMWLRTNLKPAERLPVRGYIALVSVMAACATTYGVHVLATPASPTGALLPAVGGVLFFLSDLAVARHRFVAEEFVNRAWGLPVYYAAQLLFASAVS